MAQKTLTLYLGKAGLDQFEDVFTEEARGKLALPSTRISDHPDFGDSARLYVFVGNDHTPIWLREVRTLFDVPGAILTSSAAGVLVFRLADRLFASTFAHGWMYLDDHRFEGDFGLRAAINALDDALDLIRKISGRTRDDSSANAMTGARSLRVTGEFGLADLPTLAAEALDYYESVAYQQTQFAILDSVMPVADRELSELLDDLAAASIRDGLQQFELGLPIGFDDQTVSYKFMGPGLRGSHPDLLLRHYAEAMGPRLADLTVETLRAHKIVAMFDDDNRPDVKWSVRSSLVGSLVHEHERYAVNEGEWYRIEQGFKDAIEAGFLELIEDWEHPPEPLRRLYSPDGEEGRYEPEAAYNARFAEASGFILLDRALIRIPGVERSDFESCDILDVAGKRFLHVKKSSRRSSVLSHFFKQGANSARLFSTFEPAWEHLRDLVEARAGAQAAEDLDAACLDDRPWRVEFIIADTPRENGAFNIPFFSKVSLRDEVRTLRAMRYEAVLRFIALQAG